MQTPTADSPQTYVPISLEVPCSTLLDLAIEVAEESELFALSAMLQVLRARHEAGTVRLALRRLACYLSADVRSDQAVRAASRAFLDSIPSELSSEALAARATAFFALEDRDVKRALMLATVAAAREGADHLALCLMVVAAALETGADDAVGNVAWRLAS